MKSNHKGLLFGGALMAAGLTVTQSAQADFNFSFTLTRAGAFDYAGDDYAVFADFAGAGPWSAFAEDGPAAAALSEGSANAIRLHADSAIDGGAYGNLPVSFFTVTDAATCDVSWSFDAGAGFVYLYNLTDDVALVSEVAGTGATAVSLEVGKEYFARALALSFADDKGKTYVNIVIPAPAAALPLLAAGGLWVARRRRRD